MHLDYKVRVPNPHFFIGHTHKLIPFVMAGCLKKYGKKVGYSGPTLVSIRSMNRDSSCAVSHMVDFDTFVLYEQFREGAKTSEGQVKPLVFMSMDACHYEVPKNQQTMAAGILHFIVYDLDALFIFAHALGSTA